MIDKAVEHGWRRGRAETLWMLTPRKPELAAALRTGSDEFAAATYELCDAIFRTPPHPHSGVPPPAGTSSATPSSGRARSRATPRTVNVGFRLGGATAGHHGLLGLRRKA